MRIFQRLRGRDRGENGIERKLVKTIAEDLLRRIDDEDRVTAPLQAKSSCCTCCSAEVSDPRSSETSSLPVQLPAR